MDIRKIEQVAQDAMAKRKEQEAREPGWLFHHGRRTAKISMQLCDALNADVDKDIVYAGAIFHDIGKGSHLHNEIGAEITCNLLNELCTPSELHGICDIVRNHNQRKRSRECPLTVGIVQDADLIDHVGLIVPWLAFYWSGAHNETIHDHMRFICGDDNKRYRKGMRNALNFHVSRHIFDERVSLEDDFFARFHHVYMEGI